MKKTTKSKIANPKSTIRNPKSKILNHKSTIQNPQSIKAFIDCLAQLKKQKKALQRLITTIEETEKELLTKTNLYTLYDIQRDIRNQIKTDVINSDDDLLKSIFADVLDGTGKTPV